MYFSMVFDVVVVCPEVLCNTYNFFCLFEKKTCEIARIVQQYHTHILGLLGELNLAYSTLCLTLAYY